MEAHTQGGITFSIFFMSKLNRRDLRGRNKDLNIQNKKSISQFYLDLNSPSPINKLGSVAIVFSPSSSSLLVHKTNRRLTRVKSR